MSSKAVAANSPDLDDLAWAYQQEQSADADDGHQEPWEVMSSKGVSIYRERKTSRVGVHLRAGEMLKLATKRPIR